MIRLAIVAVIAGLLSLACAREGYVLEAEGPSTRQAPVSTAEVERMCAEAFVPLAGAKAGMTKTQIHALVTRQYGRAAADAIDTSYGESILAREDTLFLYTSALCKVKGLPARCRQACDESEDIGKAK